MTTPTHLEPCKAGQHTMSDENHCQCGFYPRPTYKLCVVEDDGCESCQ